MIDFSAVNEQALACSEAILFALFPEGKRAGTEFRVGSLNGEAGKSLSINIHSGVWKDFSGGEGGSDLVSLVAAKHQCSQAEAAKKLMESLGMASPEKDKKPTAKHIIATEENFPAAHPKLGKPSASYIYRTADGAGILGLICRFDTEGKKEIMPLALFEEGENKVWRWKGFSKPRPLYGLDRLAAKPSAPVVLVEGEKCADALGSVLQNAVVVTWPGGAGAFRQADWSPLADRRVAIWPDNDTPGTEAAQGIADILSNSAASVKILPAVEGKPKGWDAADAISDGWTYEDILNHIKSEQVEAEIPADEPIQSDDRVWPFRLLGYDKGNYFYLPKSSNQLVSLTANEHRELQLLQLAPMNFWEGFFPSEKGCDWKAAANALIQLSHARGIFSARKIRGRGAWIDESRVVYHLGDKLRVDGNNVEVHELDSKFVYELSQTISCPTQPPALNADAAKLIELCVEMPWRNPLSAKFFAGWLVLAPIAGVLNWRPHIWLNGPSGTGKSWILYNVLQPLIGDSALNVQSVSTEAGIRQVLGTDSLPVIFDEAESEDKAGQLRIQKILELARGASSESGSSIVKGSAGGGAIEYSIRTCFCFSSIGVGATQRSDLSRITPLELQKRADGKAQFERLKALRSVTTANPLWCDSIRSRSLHNANTIRHNAIVFAAAVASHLGDQRVGDQLGALLAGAYSLTSTNIATPEFAAQWVANQDWQNFESVDIDKDEYRALSVLCDHLIKLDGDTNKTLAVSELIKQTINGEEDARAALIRHGIKLTHEYVSVSNSHSAIARIFKETPWAGKWKDQFSRIDGATADRERYNGIQQRVIRIPIGLFQH